VQQRQPELKTDCGPLHGTIWERPGHLTRLCIWHVGDQLIIWQLGDYLKTESLAGVAARWKSDTSEVVDVQGRFRHGIAPGVTDGWSVKTARLSADGKSLRFDPPSDNVWHRK
jgi:hypothetical protein